MSAGLTPLMREAWPTEIGRTRLSFSAATAYYYRVCAYNAGGNSLWSNVASATTRPTLDVKAWPLYR
jgi:hypothetical protein